MQNTKKTARSMNLEQVHIFCLETIVDCNFATKILNRRPTQTHFVVAVVKLVKCFQKNISIYILTRNLYLGICWLSDKRKLLETQKCLDYF